METIKLHLGCGWRNFGNDWFHIDGGDYEHLIHKDITKLPFQDNVVDEIYASHVLEYFDREEAFTVLAEWHRVLKPGGKLRIAVPDFETMTDLYHLDKISLDDILGPLFGKMSMDNDTIYHKTTYDEESLSNILTSVGYRKPHKYQWEDYQIYVDNDDHSQSYLCPKGDKINGALISLNIEATK